MANIYGTTGNDTGGNTLFGTGSADKIYGYGGDDTLDGGEGNDVLYGGAGNDNLYGGEGNDQLTGGEGDDLMSGGNGNDTYYVDSAGDIVIEGVGGGTDTVVSSLHTYQLKANFEVLRLSNDKDSSGNYLAVNGKGNGDNNTIIGNDGNNNLSGLGGNDSINGGLGDDIISGGDGNDILVGGDGTDLVSYKDATSGVTVSLAITSNQNTGGSGIDKISGFENLEGSQFSDTLTGDAGNNKISGLGGNDRIRGGAGDDDITGGADADTFVFESASTNGFDRIRAFDQSDTVKDVLEFKASDGYSLSGFSFNETTDILSYNDGVNTYELAGFATTSLTEAEVLGSIVIV